MSSTRLKRTLSRLVRADPSVFIDVSPRYQPLGKLAFILFYVGVATALVLPIAWYAQGVPFERWLAGFEKLFVRWVPLVLIGCLSALVYGYLRTSKLNRFICAFLFGSTVATAIGAHLVIRDYFANERLGFTTSGQIQDLSIVWAAAVVLYLLLGYKRT